MTPEEITLSPETVQVEDANIDTAQQLSSALDEPAPQPQPEEAVHHEPQPVQPAKAPRRKPHIMIRIPLQILSFVLCIALFVTTLAGALVLDVRQLTSAGGIKELISAAMEVLTGAPAKVTPEKPRIAPLSARLDEEDTGIETERWTIIIDENGNPVVIDEDGNVIEGAFVGNIVVDENGNVVSGGLVLDENGNLVLDGDLDIDLDIGADDIPEDILNGGNTEEGVSGLIDWLYDQVAGTSGEELPITKEQLQNFVAASTVGDYLGEKLAGFADDYINGTHNTTISADELMELLEENEEALKEHLQIELSPETKEELHSSLDTLVQESGINEIIREEVFGAVDEMLEESTSSMGVSMDEIRGFLQILTGPTMLWIIIGINLGLLLLLCLLNFYNVPAGLTWASVSCILSGGLLSLPLLVMNSITVEGQSVGIFTALSSFANVFKPIHFGLLAMGIGLLAGSIVWRVLRANRSAK